MTEMIRELMIQSVGAFLAVFGFSLLVDMPRKYLVYAGITGGAGWLAYLVSMQVGTSQVAAAFFSSLAAALLSQVFARVLKAPVTIFLVAGILPTVPGASIYRSVYFLIQGQTKWYNFYLIQTIQIAGRWRLPSLLWIHCSVCSGIKRRSGTGRQVETALNPAKIINMI